MKRTEPRHSAKRGFTLLELMLVVAILGILMTVAFTSIAGVVKRGRQRRAESLCKIVETGLATYYAQFDQWPGSVGKNIEDGTFHPGSLNVTLSAGQAREMIKALVDEAKKGNPLMDITGLFVSRDQKHGLDFLDAIHGTRKSSRKMKSSEMWFGYPDPGSGRFRHFRIVYNVATDYMHVGMQP
jgi:prepilin-type N-terminal cleavage/methylation domain-containing protein